MARVVSIVEGNRDMVVGCCSCMWMATPKVRIKYGDVPEALKTVYVSLFDEIV